MKKFSAKVKQFFNKLAVKFQRFMVGRYGIDELYKALLWMYLILIILVAIINNVITSTVLYYIVSCLPWAFFIFIFYRVFSKNIEKRRKENEQWLKFTFKVKKRFKLFKDRWKFRKQYVFKKCPKCKVVLRLKRKKGKHNVCCPHCGQNFKVNVLVDAKE